MSANDATASMSRLLLPPVLAAALLAALPAFAGVASAPAEPAARQHEAAPAVVDSDSDCKAEQPEPVAPKALPPLPPLVLDHGCWIDYAEAEKLKPLWVDARPLPETRVAPMPGTLQIPLYQIATKAFLKEAPAVLIGNGADDAEMAAACHQLKTAGFTALRMLRYGARAWYRAGRPLLGDANTVMTLDGIDAGHFYRGQIAQTWRVIGVNLPTAAYSPVDTSPSPAIPSLGMTPATTEIDDKTIDQAIDKIQAVVQTSQQARERTQSSPYLPTTVIVAADEAATQQLRQRWQERFGRTGPTAPEGMLWLIGGWRDYQTFVVQQQRIAAVAANPPSLRRPCGS